MGKGEGGGASVAPDLGGFSASNTHTHPSALPSLSGRNEDSSERAGVNYLVGEVTRDTSKASGEHRRATARMEDSKPHPLPYKQIGACVAYGSVSICITLFNKAVFAVYKFNYPNVVTLLQARNRSSPRDPILPRLWPFCLHLPSTQPSHRNPR